MLLLAFWCWWEFSSLFTSLHHVIISVYPWKLLSISLKNKLMGGSRNCKQSPTPTEGVASCNLTSRCFSPASIQHDKFVGWNAKFSFQSLFLCKYKRIRRTICIWSGTIAAYKCGDYASKHWVQFPYHGVRQVRHWNRSCDRVCTEFNNFPLDIIPGTMIWHYWEYVPLEHKGFDIILYVCGEELNFFPVNQTNIYRWNCQLLNI